MNKKIKALINAIKLNNEGLNAQPKIMTKTAKYKMLLLLYNVESKPFIVLSNSKLMNVSLEKSFNEIYTNKRIITIISYMYSYMEAQLLGNIFLNIC